MLSFKQGGITYNFLRLWYDPTWDWTQISQAIGEHSNHYANYDQSWLVVFFSTFKIMAGLSFDRDWSYQ